MTPDALFTRLAQIHHDTAARLRQIEALAEQNRIADLERDTLTERAFKHLSPDAETVVLANAWDGRRLIQHAIFEVDGVLVVRPTIYAHECGADPDIDIRLPGRDGYHGPAPLMSDEQLRDVNGAAS